MKASHVLLVSYYVLLFLPMPTFCVCVLIVRGWSRGAQPNKRGVAKTETQSLIWELTHEERRQAASRGLYC